MPHIFANPAINIEQYEEKVVEIKSSKNSRRTREFVPEDMKDAHYWEKRRRNNLAAKKSREKKRLQDFVTENRMMKLHLENTTLKAELFSIKTHLGLISPSEYVRLGHVSHKATPIYVPHDQISKIDFPFPYMNSIDYGMHMVSTVSVNDLMENHRHFKENFSRKKTSNNFNFSNQLPTALPYHNVIGTSLYDIHITSVPSFGDHKGRCGDLTQGLPSIPHLTLPFCSAKMSGDQKVFAFPHKLRIKYKTLQ